MTPIDFRDLKKPTEVKKFIDSMMNEKLAGTGISSSMGMFIIELDGDSCITNKELTARVGVTKALTTRIVRQMADLGLVEGYVGGRGCGIRLTEEGVRAKELVIRCAQECLEYLYYGITPEEEEALKRVYQRVNDRIDEYRSRHGGDSDVEDR